VGLGIVVKIASKIANSHDLASLDH